MPKYFRSQIFFRKNSFNKLKKLLLKKIANEVNQTCECKLDWLTMSSLTQTVAVIGPLKRVPRKLENENTRY